MITRSTTPSDNPNTARQPDTPGIPGTSGIPAPSGGSGTAALAVTGRPYLSWSQISTFRSCPQAFSFKYVQNQKPAFTSSALLFGGAIHSALQHHFERRFTGETATLDDLVDAYRLAWHQRLEEQGDVPVRYGAGEDADKLAAQARNLLQAFMASPLADPPGDVIAIEEHLSGAIAADLPDLLAIIDLAYVVEDGTDRGLHVVDFKTSRSRWSQSRLDESADQLRLYRRLASQLVDADASVHLHFGVLVKTKTPSTQQVDVPAASSAGDLAGLIRPVWRAIRLGVDYPAPSATGCSGCAYRDRCPAHAGV